MKTILSLIFAFSIVAVFATVTHNSDNIKGDPIKKESASKTEVKKPEKLQFLTCTEQIQNGIAACYGIDPSQVCCVTVSGGYTVFNPTQFTSTFTWSNCGNKCTQICLYVNGGPTLCCFTIEGVWPC